MATDQQNAAPSTTTTTTHFHQGPERQELGTAVYPACRTLAGALMGTNVAARTGVVGDVDANKERRDGHAVAFRTAYESRRDGMMIKTELA